MTLARMTLLELSQRLANHEIASRELVEQALAAIDDPAGEGARSFIRVHRDSALGDAGRVDAMRRSGARLHPLAGIPISIKDRFDEAGVTTLGGMLRNPSMVNLFDGCALSVPCHPPGSAPVGLMIAGTQGSDRRILAIGLAVKAVLAQQRG